MKKEYLKCAVVTKKGINIKEIEELLERNTWTDPEVDNSIIPARKVECVDRRILSNRITYYNLTRKEAQKLRKDPRILGVDIIVEHTSSPESTLTANYNSYISSSTGNPALYYVNNAVSSSIEALGEYYNSGSLDIEVNRDLNLNRKGENVDVIIQDSSNNHVNWLLPDFYDENGESRFIQGAKKLFEALHNFNINRINSLNSPSDFSTLTGSPQGYINSLIASIRGKLQNILQTKQTSPLGSVHSNGVASIAIGSKYGFAPKATPITIPGSDGSSLDEDVIKIFHVSKSLNPRTNRQNPTIAIRSVGGNAATLASWVATGSLVSASFDLDSFLEPNTGFRINYAGHDLVFTSGSSTEVEFNSEQKLGAFIYEYSCLDPQSFIDKINNATLPVGSKKTYNTVDSDNPLSMFSASYSSGIFTITSSFGLPSHVRIYSGTLAQLTGSETPSGGHFLVKLTGSQDPGWDITDWAPNGTALGLNGVNTHPKNEYGLHIRPHDHHGIVNESIYPWNRIWNLGRNIAATSEDVIEFRIPGAADLALDEELADAGVIRVNSAGNKPIDEYKSASIDDTYYRPEYNIPSSHPYHSYFVSGKDQGTISNGDQVYYKRHHNHPSVIDVGNFRINPVTNQIQPLGGGGNNIDIFAPGDITVGHYYGPGSGASLISLGATSSLFEDISFYNQDQMVVNPSTYPVTASSGINSFTQSINDAFIEYDNLLTSASRNLRPVLSGDTPNTYTGTYWSSRLITSTSLENNLVGAYFTKLISPFGGTSGAAPLVGGLLALFLEKNPTANVIDCKDYLREIAYTTGSINEFTTNNEFDYVQDKQYSGSISNGLVIEHDLKPSNIFSAPENSTILNILNGAPNRILYNAEFNTAYRDTLKIKNNVKFKGGVTYNGNTNTFNLG